MTEKKYILVVEDEAPVRNALITSIKNAGLEPVAAENGVEGLEQGALHPPKIVILDVIMPKMHGVDMYKKLRQETWGKSAHVIFLTNYADDPRIGTLAEEEHCELMSKSEIKLEDVIKRIKELVA